MKIHWNQQSTKRGAVWLVGGLIATLFAWAGKDATQVITITAALAGGLGLAVSD